MARSARTRGRSARAKRRQGGIGRNVLIAALLGLVALAVLGFAGYLAVRSYLHSNKFRVLAGEETSKALEAEGEFEPFEWRGNSMYSKSFAANGTEDAFFSRMKAHEIRAKVDLAGVRRGVWAIPSVEINRFDFMLSDDRITEQPPALPGAPAPPLFISNNMSCPLVADHRYVHGRD